MNYRHPQHFSQDKTSARAVSAVLAPLHGAWRSPLFSFRGARALLGVACALSGPLWAVSAGAPLALAAQAPLATPQVLGNPFTGKGAIYARNVWDMASFGGKIYLGHGDSAANSGNTPIFSLAPGSGQFQNEFTTTSEQVDEFHVIGNALYTLDHDPTGVENGNLYSTEGGAWSTAGTIGGAGHMFGLAAFGGKLWVGGASGHGPSVWSGSGNSWSGALTGEWTTSFLGQTYTFWGNRTWMLLPVKGQLYAVQSWYQNASAGEAGFWRLNAASGQFERFGATGALLCAGIKSTEAVRYKRQVALDDGSALTLLVEGVNDHQWSPLSLVWLRDLKAGSVLALSLPGGAKPYDIIRRGDAVYVCAWDGGKEQVVVFALDASNPAAAPTELLRFAAPTFARSFEEQNGSFYFGLGCDVSPTPAQTGEIWKVASAQIAAPVAPVVTPVAPIIVPTAEPTLEPTAEPTPEPAVPTPEPIVEPVTTPVTSGPTVPVVKEPETEPVGLSAGLSGSYYRGMELSGSAVAQRVEPQLSFSVGGGASVVEAAGPSQWSASYEGFIEAPLTGELKLWTASDDGVRVWVDGQPVIDNWSDHATTWNSTTLHVKRGEHLPLRVQYFQNGGESVLQLHWEWDGKRALVPQEYLWHEATAPTPAPTVAPTPTAPLSVLPAGLSASYYKGMNLNGKPLAERVEGPLSFSVGNGASVVAAAGPNRWSASYQGYIEAPFTGPVTLWTLSDDGVRVWVDGEKVIDNWTDHSATWDAVTFDMVRGERLPIRVEYFQNGGESVLQLHWTLEGQNRVLVPMEALRHDATPATSAVTDTPEPTVAPEPVGLSAGLSGSYYRGMELSGSAVAQRVEPQLSFSVGGGASVVEAAGPSQWSASYEGFIEAPLTGELKLWTASDDGVRVWVDGQPVIDNWSDHATTWNSTTLHVKRGEHLPLRVQYFQNGGESVLQLYWEWDIQNRVLVPSSNLWHQQ